MEARIKAAYLEGPSAFRELDRRDLFIWLGKIYYGIIYRESHEPQLVREQAGERLVPADHLKTLSFHHFLLQSVADRLDWFPRFPGPASFHFFECLDDEDPLRRFDYMDDLGTPMLAIRIGRIGIVGVLQDWGRSENVQQPHLVAAREMKLHPTQFREVYGRLKYMTEIAWRDNVHPTVGGPECVTVLYDPAQEFRGEVDPGEQARVLASLWGVSPQAITKDGMGMSTICDMSGSPLTAPDHGLIFFSLDGSTGLWPANQVELTEELLKSPCIGTDSPSPD
ncbi:hypothetical protein FH975_00155 [Nesterenkonia sp. Hz 6-5]|nr:hypothetical protein [Nesterenkonia haasae]